MRGKCEYIRGCGVNEYWCGTYCACHYGYVRRSGQCVRSTDIVPKCPPFSTFDIVLYRCICSAGYYPVSEYVCQKCSENTYWDGFKCNNDQSVQKYCAQGYIYNGVSCVRDNFSPCGPNEYMNTAGHCVCKQGYFIIDFACSKCPYGTFFDGLTCNDVRT